MDNQPHLVPNAAWVATPADDDHLLSVFPEEVWRLILANVENMNDYNKICSASPALWEWFSDQRVHILFGPVMKVLMDKNIDMEAYPEIATPEPIGNFDNAGQTDEDGDAKDKVGAPIQNDTDGVVGSEQDPEDTEGGEEGDTDNDSSSDSEESRSDHHDEDYDGPYVFLVPLRLVCRSWRDAVDDILQVPDPDYRLIDTELTYYFTKFKRVTDFHRFENHFLSTHLTSGANPFPARALEIYVPTGIAELPPEPFYNACLNTLRQYGHHVHHIRFVMNIWSSSEQFTFFLKLKEILLLLPALKLLYLNLRHSTLTNAQVTNLVSRYQEAPTQILPSTLNSLAYKGEFPCRLLKQLLLQAPANLTFIGIDLYTLAEFRLMFDDGQVRLPLTKLRIWLAGQPIPLDEIFKTLETRYGETLTDLALDLPVPRTSVVEPDLGFLNLKCLCLGMDGGVVLELENLLSVARNLEKLYVQVHPEDVPKEEHRVIKAYRNQLDKSHIWQTFHRLLFIGISVLRDKMYQRCDYTRAEWRAGKPATVNILTLGGI